MAGSGQSRPSGRPLRGRRVESARVNKLLVTLLAAVVLGGTGWAWMNYSERVADSTSRTSGTEGPTQPRVAPVVVFLGDSFVGGSNMNSGPTWPLIAAANHGWQARTAATGGTGYLVGAATDTDFVSRARDVVDKYTPDVVVVAGGINDVGRHSVEAIAAGADQTLRVLQKGLPDTEVVMLSPFATDTVSVDTIDLDGALAAVAEGRDVPYLEVSRVLEGRSDLIGPDTVHPTDAGHTFLAEEIGPRLDIYVPDARNPHLDVR